MKRNELTSRIYQNVEDGFVTLSFKGMKSDEWKNLTHGEFIDYVESCPFWSDVEAEIYESALKDVGLDLNSFDDPDDMWEAYQKALED